MASVIRDPKTAAASKLTTQLLQLGLPFNAVDPLTKTPGTKTKPLIFTAIEHGFEPLLSIVSEEKPVMKNLRDGAGNTVLHIAARHGRLAFLKKILDIDAEENTLMTTANKHDFSPLFEAAKRGYADVVEELLKCQLRIRKTEDCLPQGPNGVTPLMLAVLYGHESTVKAFTSQLKEKQCPDKWWQRGDLFAASGGLQLFEMAVSTGNLKILQYLQTDLGVKYVNLNVPSLSKSDVA